MNTVKKSENRNVFIKAVFFGALLLFVLYSFYAFTRDNNRRIVRQNNSFIEAAARQTSERINDLIASSRNSIEIMAHLYGSVLSSPKVDIAMLKDMTERSEFDYVDFISPDGMDLASDGSTADLSDRPYFQNAMQGNSGKCVIYDSRITNETLLLFYAPFYYQDEIIGVLSGSVRRDTLDGLLSSDYFGVRSSAYLLERNGNVILSSAQEPAPENLLDSLTENNQLSAEDRTKLEQALRDGISTSFNYRGAKGAGSASVTMLRENEWALVQYFPSSVTRQMTEEADYAGIRLEIRLLAAFLVYVFYLILENRSQKKKLLTEKQKMSRIVDAVTLLFSRFALVNLENDTYEYLEDKKGSAPEKGAYADLIRYLDSKYVKDDSVAQDMATVITPAYIKTHLTEDVPYLQYEYRIDIDGDHWENLSILCLERKESLPTYILCAIQDVTALKEREMQIRLALKSASEAAEAANRSKSEFLARMSHDIRTPMNAIMGMTSVAAMHIDDPERLMDCLNKISISSRHLLALINDILDMSKIESGKFTLTEEPFDMADLVDSIVTIIHGQVEGKKQHLKVQITDITHEYVIGDTLRLQQVFVNILGNAVKFTPEGGMITFSIRECAPLIQGMACYEFVCQDTGIGMDQDFLKTIFDPFSRSQNSANIEGTGLGMSITRNIVRMMEGEIKVESELGHGSTFTVQIHLKTQDEKLDDVRDLEGLRILVADDDTDTCTNTCEILESIGMRAEWVTDGKEALQTILEARDGKDPFAAVILDWKMPGLDGVETAREIRKQIGEDLPILILSAYDWSEIETPARDAGVQVFVEKPLFRSRLVYALHSMIAQRTGDKKTEIDRLEENHFSGKRILLVEDNELNREIAEELLTYIGVTVEQAEDGAAAVELVKENPENYYDLIFMDIQMPIMNGYEAAATIRALDRPDAKRIPIIAMTANAFADDIRQALDSGMNDHVAKPVEIPKLLEALNRWL